MTGIISLWLPILVSAGIVFVVSSIIHMAPLWHKNDYPKVPNEDQVRNALRPLAIPPGDYMIPRATGGEMRSPEFAEKVKQGPNMILTVLPNTAWNMKKNLTQWLLFTLAVGVFAAYVAGRALPPGSPYLAVFRFVGVTAFIGYSVALWQDSIWYARSWSMTAKATLDGLIYALLTAGTFGWLWPK
jgi:hypothetical protein